MKEKENNGLLNLLDATPFSLVQEIHNIIFILKVELIALSLFIMDLKYNSITYTLIYLNSLKCNKSFINKSK